VSSLSGGERNRLLLAKLFTQPANLLVFDEPTNDLDAETLELLEELLADFTGTILLVSHDRDFIDNVVTAVLAVEGAGVFREYVGGYSDWLRQRRSTRALTSARASSVRNEPTRTSSPTAEPRRTVGPSHVERAIAAPPGAPTKKLSYKEQRELDGMA